MIIIIDNYDSFTYNIYQYLCELTQEEVKVFRNDAVTVDELERMNPDRLVISPGPGRPEDGGISIECIKRFAGKIPILGICLGHQAISHAFGGRIIQAQNIVHGKTDTIKTDGRGLFRSLPLESQYTRYHSLAIDPEKIGDGLEVTAWSSDGEIMGVRHKDYLVEGVQFHPESITSEYGRQLLANFLNYALNAFPVKERLTMLSEGRSFSEDEAAEFMTELTEGRLSPVFISAFLTALNCKGITAAEIAGCARVLFQKRTVVRSDVPVVDTCGTGGDEAGTFNVSSLAAVVASACGAHVAKHGNRAVSSKSGCAEFYAALGLNITMKSEEAADLLRKTGFTFLLAPLYHGAMKYAAPVRKELGIKTIMNLMGPLINPAGASYQIIGVFAKRFLKPVAEAAIMLGLKKVMTVHGHDGLDEITVTGPTSVVESDNGSFKEYEIDPALFGIPLYPPEEMKGGTAEENAALAKDLLKGKGRPALSDMVSLNAGAALYTAGLVRTLNEGYEKAKHVLVSGKASAQLEKILTACHG